MTQVIAEWKNGMEECDVERWVGAKCRRSAVLHMAVEKVTFRCCLLCTEHSGACELGGFMLKLTVCTGAEPESVRLPLAGQL